MTNEPLHTPPHTPPHSAAPAPSGEAHDEPTGRPKMRDLRPMFPLWSPAWEHTERISHLLSTFPEPDERERRRRAIRDELIRRCSRVSPAGDFEELHIADLELLFELYDAAFFGGCLTALLPAEQSRPALGFSRRLLRSGGKTEMREFEGPDGEPTHRYKIILSIPVLAGAFPKDGAAHESVGVVGRSCDDRAEVLLRLVEHELLHLFEFLATGRSSCRDLRFRGIALGLFGHFDTTHRVTPQQDHEIRRAGLRPGDHVRFPHGGHWLAGVIQRITRRATVLVDKRTAALPDGNEEWVKYYVPLPLLERVDGRDPTDANP